MKENKWEYLDNKKLFILLVIVACALYAFNNYFLTPKLKDQQSKQQAITAKKMQVQNEMSSDILIDILMDFAAVNNTNLWIHKLKIEDGEVSLTIRESDVKSIEQYIKSIVEKGNLTLESLVTKNVKSKADEVDEEEEKEPVPFAVQLYLDSITSESQEKGGDDDSNQDNSDEEFIFTYESQVKLRWKNI